MNQLINLTPRNQPFAVIALTIGYLCLSVILTITQKRWPRFNNYYRRLIHVVTGIYALLLYFVTSLPLFVIICSSYVVVMVVSKRANFFTHIHCVERETYGEALFPLGMILSALIAQDGSVLFVVSCLILTIGDPLAGLAGDLMHSVKKTYLGSLAFLITTLVIIVVFLPTTPITIAMLISIVLTYVERLGIFGTDNLLIPVLAIIFLSIL
jgi:dolichol kinase